ncbi:MAG: hypothetical protein FWF43_00760 [Propionibacteriaceae bacterium]|nr:hypothetical protein [Propionibacteriaceae bacterium]
MERTPPGTVIALSLDAPIAGVASDTVGVRWVGGWREGRLDVKLSDARRASVPPQDRAAAMNRCIQAQLGWGVLVLLLVVGCG